MNHAGKMKSPFGTTSITRQPISRGVLVGALFVIFSGLFYRYVAAQLVGDPARRIALSQPLASLPLDLQPWVGRDVPIPADVLSIAGYDDTVSRRYDERNTGESVVLFIGFSGQPRTMPSHHPMVCYPANGYTHLGTQTVELRTAGLSAIASIHSFLKPGIPETRTLVLNYYVIDGVIAKDEVNFLDKLWRTPTLGGHVQHYVAQVEISTPSGVDAAADQRRLTNFAQQSLQEILKAASSVAK